MKPLFRSVGVALLATVLVAPAMALAAYPDKPVHLIVPFPPGGATDVMSRAVGQQLSKQWGQSVIVDNRPGAGGTIGTAIAAKQRPDGYTLLMGTNSTYSVGLSLYKHLPYDQFKDFTPISLVATMPNIIVVNPKLPIHNVKELIAYAKAHPNQLRFSSSGNGTVSHLSGEMFKSMTHTQMVHVPYRGSTQAYPDLVSGRVNLMFDALVPVLPLIKSGQLRPIAVTSLKRSPIMPNIPTVAESGVPGYDSVVEIGLFAPAGTPAPVITKVQNDTINALKQPALKSQLMSLGAVPVGNTSSQFNALIRAEAPKWAKIVKESGAHID